MKLPKTPGACVDMIYKLREERLAAQKLVEERKSQEEALKQHALHNFARQDLETASGKLATASIVRRTDGDVQDWDVFFDYCAKNDAFDMVQKRLNNAAYRARLEEDVEVPGVEPVEVVSLSITKRTRK